MKPAIILIVGIPLVMLGLFVLIDKFLNPILFRRNFAKWSKEIIKNKNSQKSNPRILEKAEYGTLTTDEISLRINNRKGEVTTFSWTEVEEIHAFKRDLITTDLICLGFCLSGNRAIEIHEEMLGYYDPQPLLQKKFPEIPVDWFLDVAFPAFDTNHHVIWRKTNPAGNISS